MHRIKAPTFKRLHILLSALVWLAVTWQLQCEKLSSDLQMMTNKPTSCTYQRAYGMYGVHCGGLKLSVLPKNLKTSIEILDASDNKIRELTANMFTSYTNIKYLYLEDNSIYVVEEDALSPLTYMETLDLSQNAITTIPNGVFNLPSLRKLVLKGNPLIYWNTELIALQKPIKAPLEVMDISDCKLKYLPDLGNLPELKDYNVSDNPLVRLTPETFAHTCKLIKVDLSRSLDEIHLCSLKPTIDFLSQNYINFVLEDYSRLNNDFYQCPNFVPDEKLNITQQQCRSKTSSSPVYRTSRSTWLTVAGGLTGFVIGFMLLLYIIHRRNVAQTSSTRKNKQQNKDKDEALLNLE